MSSSNCSTVSTFDEIRCNSKVEVHEVNYVWTIINFDFLEAKGSILFSPEFSATSNDEIKWKLMLMPNGRTDSKDTISLYLALSASVAKEVYTKFKLSVLDSKKKKRITREPEIVGLDVDDKFDWGYKYFLKKDEYFKTDILVDNKLTVNCEVIFSTVCDAVTSHQWKTSCDLSENFGQLLEHSKLADVVLLVNGREYPAHKNILAARSPVFAAMFEHDVKENVENRVYISDMDEDVAGEMLRYIYTGKCENLAELAAGLLVAADKYNLNRLKIICEIELFKTLSVDNAASILALADMYGVENLKNKAIKFIVSKSIEVLNTDGWKNIQSVELLHEVCSALARL